MVAVARFCWVLERHPEGPSQRVGKARYNDPVIGHPPACLAAVRPWTAGLEVSVVVYVLHTVAGFVARLGVNRADLSPCVLRRLQVAAK